MIKLVNMDGVETKDMEFGTCELCYYTQDHVDEWFVFEDNKGNEHEIHTGYWDWGDYHDLYSIDNVVNFACFLDTKKIKTFDELDNKFDEYYNEYKDMVELK